MPIKKLKAIYIDPDNGKKTEECLVLEVLVNNKGQPDFKSKETFRFAKVINDETGKLELYPFVAIITTNNDILLADFGDTFSEYAKEQMETPTKPKFIRYLGIQIKGFDPKVGKQVITMYDGGKHPYEIVKVEDVK